MRNHVMEREGPEHIMGQRSSDLSALQLTNNEVTAISQPYK